MKNIATIIMGGGQGSRLFPLTRERAKPAVPVGGRVRLIDVPLSNCINSGLTRIYVLTQFNSASLNSHISRTYNFGSLLSTGVEVIAAELTPEHRDWFQGTADAVRRSLHHVLDQRTRQVLILAGDHVYRMDYEPFIRRHEDIGAVTEAGFTHGLAERGSLAARRGASVNGSKRGSEARSTV